jgi:hypothetical protein
MAANPSSEKKYYEEDTRRVVLYLTSTSTQHNWPRLQECAEHVSALKSAFDRALQAALGNNTVSPEDAEALRVWIFDGVKS